MSKMASGLSKQAAELPKIASISPSLSLPKIQPTNGNHHTVGAGHHGLGHHGHGHHANVPGAALAGEAAAAATASTQAVGEAVNQVIDIHSGNGADFFHQNFSNISQWGNFMIFPSFIFYVKSIFENVEVLKPLFSSFLGL